MALLRIREPIERGPPPPSPSPRAAVACPLSGLTTSDWRLVRAPASQPFLCFRHGFRNPRPFPNLSRLPVLSSGALSWTLSADAASGLTFRAYLPGCSGVSSLPHVPGCGSEAAGSPPPPQQQQQQQQQPQPPPAPFSSPPRPLLLAALHLPWPCVRAFDFAVALVDKSDASGAEQSTVGKAAAAVHLTVHIEAQNLTGLVFVDDDDGADAGPGACRCARAWVEALFAGAGERGVVIFTVGADAADMEAAGLMGALRASATAPAVRPSPSPVPPPLTPTPPAAAAAASPEGPPPLLRLRGIPPWAMSLAAYGLLPARLYGRVVGSAEVMRVIVAALVLFHLWTAVSTVVRTLYLSLPEVTPFLDDLVDVLLAALGRHYVALADRFTQLGHLIGGVLGPLYMLGGALLFGPIKRLLGPMWTLSVILFSISMRLAGVVRSALLLTLALAQSAWRVVAGCGCSSRLAGGLVCLTRCCSRGAGAATMGAAGAAADGVASLASAAAAAAGTGAAGGGAAARSMDSIKSLDVGSMKRLLDRAAALLKKLAPMQKAIRDAHKRCGSVASRGCCRRFQGKDEDDKADKEEMEKGGITAGGGTPPVVSDLPQPTRTRTTRRLRGVGSSGGGEEEEEGGPAAAAAAAPAPEEPPVPARVGGRRRRGSGAV
jgi:hypothetical protein